MYVCMYVCVCVCVCVCVYIYPTYIIKSVVSLWIYMKIYFSPVTLRNSRESPVKFRCIGNAEPPREWLVRYGISLFLWWGMSHLAPLIA